MLLPKLIFSCLLVCVMAANGHAAPQVPPSAPTKVCSAIIYDLDREVILFEQNADERIPPASLTKVMSMFLGFDHVGAGRSSLSDTVKISSAAAAVGGSRMGLRANEGVQLRKILMGMAVSSGNDASHALAEHVGGSVDAFVGLMNKRCQMLGMKDTNFANPHGLPAANQYTTARDMLRLARAYLRAHPGSLDYHNTRILEHGGYKTWNKNPLLGQYPGADGLKSGWIRASGYNLIFTATRDGHRLLAVIMGAPDTYIRSAEACRLLDAGFEVCREGAVSVAAALENMPVDLNRIDPRKTARDHGISKKRYTASSARAASLKHGRKGIPSKTEKRLLARKNSRSGSQLLARHKATRIGGPDGKGKVTRLSKIKVTRLKTHAEKKTHRAKRG